jgi:N-acetylneuraminic acid mutarotase
MELAVAKVRPVRLILVLTGACLLLEMLLPIKAGADSISSTGALFPSQISGGTAIWDGHEAYLFGTCFATCAGTDRIFRFDPSTNAVEVVSAVFPVDLLASASIWDGQDAYIFGGRNAQDTFFDQIWRYSPVDGSLTTMSAHLPSKRMPSTAVWDGSRYAYLFGGKDSDFNPLNEIVRYDIATRHDLNT